MQTTIDCGMQFLPDCLAALNRIYQRLGIEFDLALGESYYNPMLADVVSSLKSKNLARESEGAMCVFIEGNAAPFIVQKTDGAFTYATTDLATIQYRRETLKADEILYVVDKRQSEHFQQLFATAALVGHERRTFSACVVRYCDGKRRQAVQDSIRRHGGS